MKCLLCKEQEANQTGSHILTHSLISKCTNEQGKVGRNKEMMFGISQSGEKGLYVGNEVLPEKIEEIKGKQLTDDELENNNNEMVVDNIYCSDCEKLFGKIESLFSSKVLLKIRNNKIDIFKYPDNMLIRIYFFIQIWRASSYNYTEWSLSEKNIEESLRKIIFEACKDFENGLSETLEREIVSFPLIINYMETPENESSSNWVFIPNETSPYLFFLCDFVVEFFPYNNKPQIAQIANYRGLNNLLEDKHINFFEENFIIRFLDNSTRKQIIANFSKGDIAKGEIQRIQKLFIYEYLKKNNKIPDPELFSRFNHKIFQEEMQVSIIERLSDERIFRIIHEHLAN